MGRITEKEVGVAVLHILAGRQNGEATVETLKAELPKHLTLSADDQTGSTTRSNEQIWEQQVQNLRSNEPTPGNIFFDGFVIRGTSGEWRITPLGRKHIGARV